MILPESDYDAVLVVNTLPWERTVSGPVSKYVAIARGEPDDHLSARHWQDRNMNGEQFLLPPTAVPGFGYRVVPTSRLVPNEEWPYTERSTVETDRFRIEFDRERGGIASWTDGGREWVDREASYPLGGFVLERLADEGHPRPRDLLFRGPPVGENNPEGLWNAAPEIVEPHLDSDRPADEWGYQRDFHAERRSPERVKRHRVYRTPLGFDVRQTLAVPGLGSDVELRVLVPEAGEGIVIEATWEMDRDVHPTSTYLAFPFDLREPTAHVDVGGQAMEPGRDQLPGTCHDYYTAQRWVSVSNEERGVTVGCPLNPMVQFGDFSYGDAAFECSIERALVLGWTTSNFYNTNFRAHQPGRVRARYHLRPHDGAFEESRAHRAGLAAEHHEPLVQPLAEGQPGSIQLPESGTFLDLPSPPVLVTNLRPAGDAGTIFPMDEAARGHGRIDVTLLNASDSPRTAVVGSGILSIGSARVVDILGAHEGAELSVEDGIVERDLDPREMATIRFECGD